MGSIGANKGTTTTSFVGKNVNDLYQATQTYESLRNTFNLQSASDAQLSTLSKILRGVDEYDRSRGDKIPYNITSITIKQLGATYTSDELKWMKAAGMRQSKPDIYVDIYAKPNVDNALIRMMDEKHHHAIIGPKGGLYVYVNGGKKKALDLFKVQYGERSGI